MDTPKKPQAVRYTSAFNDLTFLANRVPSMSETDNGNAYFARLADYRDGGIFIAHYQGNTEWERHLVGDEVVMVLDGCTTLTLMFDGEETAYVLSPGELLVVPQGYWHRFETPDEVKVMTITPQPTDHVLEVPLQ